MAQVSCIPNLEEAFAAERRDRAACLLGLPELIAGIPCVQLTPRRLEWLRAFHNPFICGGNSSVGAVFQFLWFVNPSFDPAGTAEQFTEAHADLDILKSIEDIGAYLDRAFADSPHGKAGKPHYAAAVGLYHSLNVAYPNAGWTTEKVMDTPLATLYQLIKADDLYHGRVVINRKSDQVIADWNNSLETITTAPCPRFPNEANYIPKRDQYENQEAFEAASEDMREQFDQADKSATDAYEREVTSVIESRRADGWGLYSEPSQNRDGSWSFAMRRKPTEEETNG